MRCSDIINKFNKLPKKSFKIVIIWNFGFWAKRPFSPFFKVVSLALIGPFWAKNTLTYGVVNPLFQYFEIVIKMKKVRCYNHCPKKTHVSNKLLNKTPCPSFDFVQHKDISYELNIGSFLPNNYWSINVDSCTPWSIDKF